MARRMLLKAAAAATGLSIWELRTGAIAGKYPYMRVGNPKTGKMLFDLDMLEARIAAIMQENIGTQARGGSANAKIIKIGRC